ncbi:ricin-type beta-trefoil lectin domain protein [Streptacidiphilus cavernicola]|uniref:Ricin-type beta-trefoil lectin domain protein n=1 Tax=Streptacidiphilus cavernicola TaxID=3342716 RepID=A0ABV6VP76_9ACTN
MAHAAGTPRATATAPASPPVTAPAGAPATSAAGTASASAAGTAAATASAPAAAGGTGASLKNPATGKCLSAGPGTDGTPLVLAGCDGAPDQAWHAAPDGTIQSQGLCMDAAWGAVTPGTVVQVARCSGNPAQQFSLRDGTVYSQQVKLCVGQVNGGAAIRLAACTGPATVLKQF